MSTEVNFSNQGFPSFPRLVNVYRIGRRLSSNVRTLKPTYAPPISD